MTAEIALVVALLVAVCLGRWKLGLMLCPLVGFAQDPVRKLLPSQPVIVVVLVAGLVGVCLVSALLRGNLRWVRTALAAYPEIHAPIVLFSILVVVQALRTFVVYGNRTLAGIGLLGYLSPLGAVGAFYLLGRNWRDARRWLAIYVGAAAVAGATVVLHFLGFSPRVFESIALDSVYGVGIRVQMYCGILRSSEFAAFHSATAACIALAWASGIRRLRALVPAGLLTGLLVVAVLVSGRRKMLAQLALWLVVFLFLEARARGRRGRLLTATTALGIAAGFVATLSARDATGSTLQPYLVRGGSVLGESLERLKMMTVDAFSGVFANVGFFGAGAGIASQGSQHYGQQDFVLWSNAEGGLGRVMAELGVPGLLLLAAIAWASVRALRKVARFAARLDVADSYLVLGLIAILPSNALVFISAQQLYGDPFVLIVLGAVFGLVLGFPPAVALARGVRPAALARTQVSARGVLPAPGKLGAGVIAKSGGS